MCGIVGMATTTWFGLPEEKFLKNALYADFLRGKDSTGLLAVGKGDKRERVLFKKG